MSSRRLNEMTHARFDTFTTRGGRSMEFSAPTRVIPAYDVGQVMAVLEEAEAAARGGLWAVGFVAYEAAPAFDPSLPVRGRDRHDTPADLPLAWFALFTDPMEAVPFCLLYTSDAADDLTRVDLGGR